MIRLYARRKERLKHKLALAWNFIDIKIGVFDQNGNFTNIRILNITMMSKQHICY